MTNSQPATPDATAITWKPGLTEYSRIRWLAMVHPRDAHRSQEYIDQNWERNEFAAPPNLERAKEEYERLIELIADNGMRVDFLPVDDGMDMASIYARDACIVSSDGVILCSMRNGYRRGEPAVHGRALEDLGVPVIGGITGGGTLEGGDFVWLDETTCAVAHGYRTNPEGIRQLRSLLGPEIHVEVAPLPHYKGVAEVLHLMSILSPLDRDLALVYSKLMPIPFRNWLLDRGMELVEVPDEEYDSQGCNVLAVGPRRCVVVDGNPITRSRLEASGCEVIPFQGEDISVKGMGGPTCLTRPLVRER
jgi:N-dimethylarginine dimethylaminohydrolase